MAANSQSLSSCLHQNLCKKCKKVAESGVKCVECGQMIHSGCIKYLKSVKVREDGQIVCCEKTVTHSPGYDPAETLLTPVSD